MTIKALRTFRVHPLFAEGLQQPLAELANNLRHSMLSQLRDHRDNQHRQSKRFEALTAREREVLQAWINGDDAQVIARRTFTSIRTVRGHIQNVLHNLGVNPQLAAVARAKEAEWSLADRLADHSAE